MDALTEISRRLENLIRLGTIAEVDLGEPPRTPATVRVRTGGLLTAGLPWISLRAGDSVDWDPPTVGEQCVVFSPSGEPTQGVVLVGLYSELHPQPAKSETLRRRTYPDGALIDYDHAQHALTATLPAGGTVTLTAPGGVTVIGDITVQGQVTVSKDVLAGEAQISLVNHKTTGVDPGSGLSGAPV